MTVTTSNSTQNQQSDGLRKSWATPPSLFHRLDQRFGFTLDVCASASNTKCERYFDQEANSLSQDWGTETCFMNPPYGTGIEVWMEKAYKSSFFGATVVCIVPASTDTRWWHDWATLGEVEFLKPRVQFVPPPGVKASSCSFGSALVTFWPKYERSCFEEDELAYERAVWGESMSKLAPYLMPRHTAQVQVAR